MVETVAGEYWNHNVHYQRVILEAVPDGCGAAIDVGCEDGMLARKLAARCAAVTGIDRDERIIEAARERGRAVPAISLVHGDFLAYPFAAASFDFACANTVLHHMDFGVALAKMARILRPGGRLAVVGLARNVSPADWLVSAAGIPADRYYKHAKGEGNSGAPVMGPGHVLVPGPRGRRPRPARRPLPPPPAVALLRDLDQARLAP